MTIAPWLGEPGTGRLRVMHAPGWIRPILPFAFVASLFVVAAPPTAASDGAFTDTATSPFRVEIDWMARSGISNGCGDGRFCPTALVTRGEMASFLSRALELAPSGTDAFGDDSGSLHEDAINRLAASGLTRGCAPSRYCPGAPVSRGEMASFLARAFGVGAASADYFADDAASVHQSSINAVAGAGITGGCATWRYCPGSSVSRGQMAAFLYRAMVAPGSAPAVRGTCTRYVAPNGSDAAAGTKSAPWATLIGASRRMVPGDIVCVRGGTYPAQGGYGFAADGVRDAPVVIRSYPGERAVFDGRGREQWVILNDVDWVQFWDLTITGYHPENNGVVILINGTDHVSLDGLTVSGNWGESPSGRWNEHAIYPGAGVGSVAIRNSLIDAGGLPGGAIHVYHNPGPRYLLIENNVLRNGHWGVIVASTARHVVIRGNTIQSSTIPLESWSLESRLEVYGNQPGNTVR
jgi:hypothetical protein